MLTLLLFIYLFIFKMINFSIFMTINVLLNVTLAYRRSKIPVRILYVTFPYRILLTMEITNNQVNKLIEEITNNQVINKLEKLQHSIANLENKI